MASLVARTLYLQAGGNGSLENITANAQTVRFPLLMPSLLGCYGEDLLDCSKRIRFCRRIIRIDCLCSRNSTVLYESMTSMLYESMTSGILGN